MGKHKISPLLLTVLLTLLSHFSDRSKDMTKAIEEANAQITMLEELIEKSKLERLSLLKVGLKKIK